MENYRRKIGLTGLVCVGALILICTFWLNVSDAREQDFSNSVVVGQVSEIEGSLVTLQLGQLEVQEPPAKPDGDVEPPAKPEDNGRTMQLQSEAKATATIIPQEAPGAQPDMLLLSNSTEAKGQAAGADKPNEMYSFTAGEDCATLDLSGAAVYIEEHLQTTEGGLADIAVDDVLELEVGEKNRVVTATVKNVAAENFGGSVEQGTAANLLAEDGVLVRASFS